ncbi:MAG: 50S ribosomal protein L35 [Cyanobacteriota bacterium]
MPKVKTRKSAAKRYSVTGSGKIMRRSAGTKHLLTGKRKRRVRALKVHAGVHHTDMDRVISQLPYLNYL